MMKSLICFLQGACFQSAKKAAGSKRTKSVGYGKGKGVLSMGRFRKIRFQNMVFLYSICLVAIFLFAEFVFMANTRIEIPEQMKGYYVSADHMMLTEQGFGDKIPESSVQ